MKIVGEDGRELPHGEIGEIVTRSDCVMLGYWNNPDANAKAIRDGWLWTGDLGAMDADGFVTLKDRSKDMIISGGSNIYPREIEDVLLQRIPPCWKPRSSAARTPTGARRSSPSWCSRAGASLDAPELDRLCLDNIARFKRPKSYRFVDALPKNNYGKILKTELRSQLQKEPSP